MGECRGKTVERTTNNADIVGMRKVGGQGGGGRKDFEIVCEELPSAAAAFAVLDGMEKRFEVIVGALHEADASASAFGNGDGMSPKIRAVTIQMRQDQVDGLPRVFSGASFRTLLSERSGQFADGGLDVVELADGVLWIDSGRDALDFKLESGSKLVKQVAAFANGDSDGGERRHVRLDGTKDPPQFFEGFADFSIGGRLAPECFQCGGELKATAVKIQPGKVEGKTQTGAVGVIVQNPLSETPDNGDAARAVRDRVNAIRLGQPQGERIAAGTDGLSQIAALLADEGAKLRQQFGVAKQIAKLMVSVLEQPLADIGEEVKMAGQDRNRFLQGSDKLAGGLGHGTAEVAHDGTRRPEGRRNALDAGKDEFRTFGGRLPRAEHPTAPTGKGGDHRAAAIFTGGVDVKRPAAVGF